MLSLDHPDILQQVIAFPGGLLPIRPDGRLALVIKASKEALLAIREHRGLSVYVVPIPAANGEAISIISAFFDDADEPLVIRTPLFGDEPPSVEIVALLMAPEFDIFFFDELGREWMGYGCAIEDPGSHLVTHADRIQLAPFSASNSVAILSILGEWFGLRTPEDDARAIKVRLRVELWPDDLALLDVRDGPHAYVGSDGYAITALERDATRPGFHQERDIATILRRFLAPEQIILNPIKRGTSKEFADVVCGTERAVLVIQAKDSPNTAQSLSRSIDRKLLTSASQLEGALKQVGGAVRYAAQGEPILLTVKAGNIDLHVAGRELVWVVVIKEIFPQQSPEILAALDSYRSKGQCLVILDYPGLSGFVHHFSEEDRFVEELKAYSESMTEDGQWNPAHAFLIGRFLDGMPGGAVPAGAPSRGRAPTRND